MDFMVDLNSLILVLKEHGAGALVLIAAVFMLLNSKFTLQYPRSSKKDEDNPNE